MTLGSGNNTFEESRVKGLGPLPAVVSPHPQHQQPVSSPQASLRHVLALGLPHRICEALLVYVLQGWVLGLHLC